VKNCFFSTNISLQAYFENDKRWSYNAATAKGTGPQGRTGPKGRSRRGRDSTHRRSCGTFALNPVALCDTQRAVKEIVKSPTSEQFSKRP